MSDTTKKIKSVYTAHSKHNFYARRLISAYVLEKGRLPLNPFTNWDYFMDDMVNRKLTVRANINLIYLADEIWQFNAITDDCYHELELAAKLDKKVHFFTVGKTIPAEKIPQIFDRFYQVDKSTEGSGLGLAIAKEITERNNWKLEISSQSNITTAVLKTK